MVDILHLPTCQGSTLMTHCVTAAQPHSLWSRFSGVVKGLFGYG